MGHKGPRVEGGKNYRDFYAKPPAKADETEYCVWEKQQLEPRLEDDGDESNGNLEMM